MSTLNSLIVLMWSSDPQTRAIGISAFLQRGSCIQHRVRRSWQSDDVLLSSGVCLLTCQCCCVDFHSQEHQCGSEAHENKEKHPSTAEWEATATTAAAQVRFCVSNAGLSYMILHYLTWNSNYNSKQLACCIELCGYLWLSVVQSQKHNTLKESQNPFGL